MECPEWGLTVEVPSAVASFQATTCAAGAWSTAPQTDTGVESCCRSDQDCPHTGVCREVELSKKALMKAELEVKNSISGDPDCSCRSVHREGQETSGRGGREDLQGCRGVAPGQGGERLQTHCGGRGTSGASERPTRSTSRTPPPPPPTVVRGQDMEAEVTRLRAQVVQLQAQAQNAAVKRRVVGSRGDVSLPHSRLWVRHPCTWFQLVTNWRSHANCIPHLGFAHIPVKLLFQDVVDDSYPLWSCSHVFVVQKRENPLRA